MHLISSKDTPKAFDVRPSRDGWQAFCDGRPLGQPVADRKWAEAQIERQKRKQKLTERSCLTCSKTFASEGPHNRMCSPCRNDSVWPF